MESFSCVSTIALKENQIQRPIKSPENCFLLRNTHCNLLSWFHWQSFPTFTLLTWSPIETRWKSVPPDNWKAVRKNGYGSGIGWRQLDIHLSSISEIFFLYKISACCRHLHLHRHWDTFVQLLVLFLENMLPLE